MRRELREPAARETEAEEGSSALVQAAMAYVQDLFQNDFGGHDAAHTLRVYRNALAIAEAEPSCDREIVALGALLHDVDDHKLFATENNENARRFLTAHGVDGGRIEAVCRVINAVSFSQNRGRRPETPEGRIVQDADRLDALGAVGIARTFAYGGAHGRSLEASIQHFHEKLLLLRDELNTETARRLAEKRHGFLNAFLAEYGEETRA
ncbi:MAG: HD domain-containing protein [Clostridia bacterium]|nr:HD domain-containing protein [Clostridia bacterium]MBQ6892535.1 HD domain-containing protein [Clostridia bacterium]MBQ7754405.1 HD domain-containing protein [Clostridia bacterium]MBQ9923132.1 HD domain-containing protein [Clostridia bacterium]MBR0421298.1 HD domain-containing protein [Clostridia bacterium]